jgi:hypothetical protein
MAETPVRPETRRPIDSSAPAFFEKLSDARRKVDVKIFLCGASIQRGQPPPAERREAALRYEVMERLEGQGCPVILGEDDAFYRAARAVLKEHATYAHHELFLAADHADLTVVFPCSAGSFAELGMFAAARGVTRKLLIFIDDQAEYRNGYIANGPALMAEYEGTFVEFVSYDDIERVWTVLQRHVNRIAMGKIKDEILTRQ